MHENQRKFEKYHNKKGDDMVKMMNEMQRRLEALEEKDKKS